MTGRFRWKPQPPEPRTKRAGKLGPWGACALVLLGGAAVIFAPMVKESSRPKVGECLAAGSGGFPTDEVVPCAEGDYEVVVSSEFVGSRGGDVCRMHPDGESLIVGYGRERATWELCAVPLG